MGNGHGKLQDEQESLSVHQSAHISHEESAALQACFLVSSLFLFLLLKADFAFLFLREFDL